MVSIPPIKMVMTGGRFVIVVNHIDIAFHFHRIPTVNPENSGYHDFIFRFFIFSSLFHIKNHHF